MTLFGLALSNLMRRRTRTLLSILGIGLAIGGAVALLSLGRGIVDSVASALEERGTDFIVTQRGTVDVFGGRLPEGIGARLEAVPGVASVAGEMITFTATDGDRQVLVAGWAPNSPSWGEVRLIAGHVPRPEERRVVLIGDAAAETLGLKPGDGLTLFEERFTVAGIARWASVMNRGIVAMRLAELQEVSFRPGQVTGFLVRLAPGADAAAVRQALSAAGPVLVSDAREMVAQDRNLAVLQAVSYAVSLIALALGGLNVLSTQLMAVQERRREIAMIAAMGWSDTRLIGLVVLEGMVLGVAGCVLGIGIGIAASGLFGAIPQIGHYIAFKPTVEGLVLPVIGALALCLLGALYPAWRAASVMPAEALRRG